MTKTHDYLYYSITAEKNKIQLKYESCDKKKKKYDWDQYVDGLDDLIPFCKTSIIAERKTSVSGSSGLRMIAIIVANGST